MSAPPTPAHAADPGRRADDDDFSTAATAAENTPLLRSPTSSTGTLRDGSSSSRPDGGHSGDVTEEPVLGWKRAVCIILSMWALIFLQASNTSGMTMTQSTIAADLNAYEGAMWFTSAYLIAVASMAPLVGRLAMIFSPGLMTLASSLFFVVGALVSSQAMSFAVFILGRVLVGIGGAGVMTLSMILVLQLTSKRRRGLFIGLVNAGFTIGLSTGAVVFGALLPTLGWRALFLAQAVIGFVSGFGVWFSIPHFAVTGSSKNKSTVLEKLAKIDYLGAITLTLSLVLFLYGLSGKIQLLPIFLSVITLAAFIATEYLHASDPIIPISVLQSRGVLLSCLAQLGLMAARWTVLFYAPVFVLAVRGLSPAVSGSILIPTNAGFGTGGLVVGWLHVKRAGSFWAACLVSIAAFGLAILGLSFVSNAAADAWVYIAVVFLNGFATGAALNYTLAHMLHLAEPENHFIATSLLTTFRGFAGSFGTAIGGGVFARTLSGVLAEGFERLDGAGLSKGRLELITRLIGSPALVYGGDLSDAERAVAVEGYEAALKVLYQGAAAVCLLVLAVQAGTGWAAPLSNEEEEEIGEEIAEADQRMEA
ncbi:MFS general substrate transporter [Coniochaeta hoffmannii]|uniref:MFS general substrate transporter n=1 Tax=Coniochaeta hoffmannii TaxID=91930 RepID=A0AA38RD90_9PEZI|nr:MFS general substrate transporter [Coniochaeta hoffmannii]